MDSEVPERRDASSADPVADLEGARESSGRRASRKALLVLSIVAALVSVFSISSRER
jgi:hypothetical protein